jgi:hypothetical protein
MPASSTLAYSSSSQPPDTIASALEGVPTDPVEASIQAASLIELHRDNRMYEWRTIAQAAIGASTRLHDEIQSE